MDCEDSVMRQIADGRTDLFERIVAEYQNLIYTVCFNIEKHTGR